MKGYYKKLVQKIWKEKQKKNTIEADGDNSNEPNFRAISHSLDELYCLEKLKLYCNMLSRQGIIHQVSSNEHLHQLTMIEAVKHLLNTTHFDNPILAIYLKIQALFETEIKQTIALEQDLVLNEIEYLLAEHTSTIEAEEQIQIYSFLTNYVTKKINSGNDSYQVKIIQLYNEILNLRYGKVKRNTLNFNANIYRNIVKIALRINEDAFFQQLQTHGLKPDQESIGFSNREEWLMKFIEYYKQKLPTKSADKYYRYCKSLVLFHQEDFIKAFKSIGNPTRVRGLYINLDLKILYLQILYELNDQKSNAKFWRNNNLDIFKVIDAYRKTLQRETQEAKKIGYQINYFLDFLNLFRLLFNFHWNYSGVYTYGDANYLNKKEELKLTIKQCPYSYQLWFEEKYKSLLH